MTLNFSMKSDFEFYAEVFLIDSTLEGQHMTKAVQQSDYG